MTIKEATNTYRTTARVVGVIYLMGFVVGIAGIQLYQSILGAPNHLSTLSAAKPHTFLKSTKTTRIAE